MTNYKRSLVKSVLIIGGSVFTVGLYAIYLKHGGDPTPISIIPILSFLGGCFMLCKAIFLKWWRGNES